MRLFLQLGWGGAYRDKEKDGERVRDAFEMADRLVEGAERLRRAGVLDPCTPLTVVATDYLKSGWSGPDGRLTLGSFRPRMVLREALEWVESH